MILFLDTWRYKSYSGRKGKESMSIRTDNTTVYNSRWLYPCGSKRILCLY